MPINNPGKSSTNQPESQIEIIPRLVTGIEPTTREDNSNLQVGDTWYNSLSNFDRTINFWSGANWLGLERESFDQLYEGTFTTQTNKPLNVLAFNVFLLRFVVSATCNGTTYSSSSKWTFNLKRVFNNGSSETIATLELTSGYTGARPYLSQTIQSNNIQEVFNLGITQLELEMIPTNNPSSISNVVVQVNYRRAVISASPRSSNSLAFESRVTANGGTLTNAQRTKIDNYFAGLETNNLRNKILEAYWFQDVNFSTAMVKLISAATTGSLTPVNITSGNYSPSTGLAIPSNGYLKTGVILSNFLTASGVGLTSWFRRPFNSSNHFPIGAQNGNAHCRLGFISGTLEGVLASTYTPNNNSSVPNSNGYHEGVIEVQAVSATDQRLFYNGSQLGSIVTTSRGNPLSNVEVYVGAVNVGGSPGLGGNMTIKYAAITTGLTDTEVGLHYPLIQALIS